MPASRGRAGRTITLSPHGSTAATPYESAAWIERREIQAPPGRSRSRISRSLSSGGASRRSGGSIRAADLSDTPVLMTRLPAFRQFRLRPAQFALNDRAQQRAQLGRSLAAEGGFKTRLRGYPALTCRREALLAQLGQMQFLAATLGRHRLDRDQAVARQRKDVPPERRSVHYHVGRQRIDAHTSLALELRENGELGRAQARRRKELIIGLGHVPRRLANRQTHALRHLGCGIRTHSFPH